MKSEPLIQNDLEEVPCPLCKGEEAFSAYIFPPYRVARCRACSFYYLSPRLKETKMLNRYSDDNYFSSEDVGYTSYLDQEKSLQATFSRFLKNLHQKGLTGGSLLEVGCGYGYLLEAATPFFEKRTGIEFSRTAAELAKQVADQVYCGDIDQLRPEERYNCIILTHVLEHIYRPKEFLKKLISHLMPGGSLVVAVPDMGSFWRLAMQHRWPSFKIPEHILFFNRKSLFQMMREAGLKDVREIPCPHAFPLSLIASKLRLFVPDRLKKTYLWLPRTTVAAYGVNRDE